MTIRNRYPSIAAVAVGLLVASVLPALAVDSATASGRPPSVATPVADRPQERPTRVVQIVLDQLRPEFIDAVQHDATSQRLMRRGASYPNAYLGHMASETVVSPQRDDQRHAAQAHGLVRRVVPRHRTACSGRRRPVRHGLHDGDQFDTLINAGGYPKLADYLHAKFPDTIVAAIGEKNYAVHTMGGPAPTCGSRSAAAPPTATRSRTSRPT